MKEKSTLGQQITQQLSLKTHEIASFAQLCGDLNPLHHDESYARQTRFKGIIACGSHITSLMMGLLATRFSQECAMLGLEFSFKFHKAILAEKIIIISWKTIEIASKESLHGDILTLNGKVTDIENQLYVTATGKILITDKL